MLITRDREIDERRLEYYFITTVRDNYSNHLLSYIFIRWQWILNKNLINTNNCIYIANNKKN